LVSAKAVDEQLANEVLIDQVARGDIIAFETLYDRHAPIILGIALKITGDHNLAEAILQETFWRMWRSASTYQSQREPLLSWLFTIVRNLAIESRRRLVGSPGHAQMQVDNQDRPELNAKQVHNIAADLSPEQRQVIEMAYFYGMTRQEIKKATGKSLESIDTDARLGLQKLDERLREEPENKE